MIFLEKWDVSGGVILSDSGDVVAERLEYGGYGPKEEARLKLAALAPEMMRALLEIAMDAAVPAGVRELAGELLKKADVEVAT